MTLLPNKLKLISLSTGLPQRVVKEVIRRFVDLAVHDLLAEGRFHHRGLGTFKVVKRRPRNITRVFGKKTPGPKAAPGPGPERGPLQTHRSPQGGGPAVSGLMVWTSLPRAGRLPGALI